MLLKNPWDVLTFAFVKQAFPGARFVFIRRHPLNLMNSQLRATRSLYTQRNPYLAMLSPWYRQLFDRPGQLQLTRLIAERRFGVGARVTGRHVVKVANYYLENIGELPAEDYVELRYEDLCAEPDNVLQRVLTFLEVKTRSPVSARELVHPRMAPVLPEVQQQLS